MLWTSLFAAKELSLASQMLPLRGVMTRDRRYVPVWSAAWLQPADRPGLLPAVEVRALLAKNQDLLGNYPAFSSSSPSLSGHSLSAPVPVFLSGVIELSRRRFLHFAYDLVLATGAQADFRRREKAPYLPLGAAANPVDSPYPDGGERLFLAPKPVNGKLAAIERPLIVPRVRYPLLVELTTAALDRGLTGAIAEVAKTDPNPLLKYELWPKKSPLPKLFAGSTEVLSTASSANLKAAISPTGYSSPSALPPLGPLESTNRGEAVLALAAKSSWSGPLQSRAWRISGGGRIDSEQHFYYDHPALGIVVKVSKVLSRQVEKSAGKAGP